MRPDRFDVLGLPGRSRLDAATGVLDIDGFGPRFGRGAIDHRPLFGGRGVDISGAQLALFAREMPQFLERASGAMDIFAFAADADASVTLRDADVEQPT